jgi:peptide/nickel transport system permease protein
VPDVITSPGGGSMATPGYAAEAVIGAEISAAGAAGTGRLRRGMGPVFWVCAGWVALMILLAVLASVLPLPNPTQQNYSAVNAVPSIHHLLGTDDLGRDLLSRVLYGSRVSLVVGFVPVIAALIVGGIGGLLAGYRGGAIDAAFSVGSFVILAFPALLAIMVVEQFWPPHTLAKLVLFFAVAGSPLLFQVIRATTLSFANREFIVAARALGARTGRILVRELLPNVLPTALAFALIGVATAVVLEGGLAFLGLSVALPTASLGNIINEGVNNNLLQDNPYIALWPSLYIFLLLTALNLMADRLRSAFDVREVKL